MAKPILLKSENRLLLQLAEISEMISENTDAAFDTLQAFIQKHKPITRKAIKAQVDLLILVIASVRNNFNEQGINDQNLVAYFKAEKKFNEATQVLLARTRHFFLNGDIVEGEKVLKEIHDNFLDKVTERVKVVYLTRLAFLHGRKNQYDEQLKVNLEALDKLKAMNEVSSWHSNISTIFYTNIANCYMANSDFEKAWPYLEQSLQIVESPSISTYNRFNVYSYIAFYHESLNDHRESAAWHEKIIALLKDDTSHQTYLAQSYLMATVQYYLHYRAKPLSKAELKDIAARQEGYLQQAASFIPADLSKGNYLTWLYTTATFEHQKGNHEKAISFLNRCMPVYEKMQHHVSLLNCMRLAHEIYAAWGKQADNPQLLYKAYELKLKESEMAEAGSKQSHLQKMEAVQTKYNLQQAELNASLLQQRMEAMQKEVQLTMLSLHEKIQVLDEIKVYVNSLKRKELDTRQLISTIAKKIEAVKLTEEEKATLQQKMSETNQYLAKILAKKYPSLSSLEIRMCSLFQTGMTNKELSKLYGQGEKSYEQHRYRIKKKMELAANDNLVRYLTTLHEAG
jgi:tetratricopeptide (TPR) repeat protein